MKIDYHLHTEFSSDCTAPMEDMIAGALRERVDSICITDHMDYGDPFEPYESYTQADYINHFKDIDRCTIKYEGIIKIAKGMEIGYIQGYEQINADFVKEYDLDFVIGSNHNLGDIDYYMQENDPSDFTKIETLYLERIIKMIDNVNYFSVVGHLNYPCKFHGFTKKLFTYDAFSDHLDYIFKKTIEIGKGIEVNTSCLQTEGAFEAFLPILKRYKELGGEIITIGSDSHNKFNVARSSSEAQAILLQAGFNYICDFKKLVPEFHAID